MRFSLVGLLLTLPASGLAAPQVATNGFAPGTYQGPGYVTKFDADGGWATSSAGATSPAGRGRYSVDGDIVTFMTAPLACKEERVRYKMTPTERGFRLHFLEDGCKRITQMPDIEFVRVR